MQLAIPRANPAMTTPLGTSHGASQYVLPAVVRPKPTRLNGTHPAMAAVAAGHADSNADHTSGYTPRSPPYAPAAPGPEPQSSGGGKTSAPVLDPLDTAAYVASHLQPPIHTHTHASSKMAAILKKLADDVISLANREQRHGRAISRTATGASITTNLILSALKQLIAEDPHIAIEISRSIASPSNMVMSTTPPQPRPASSEATASTSASVAASSAATPTVLAELNMRLLELETENAELKAWKIAQLKLQEQSKFQSEVEAQQCYHRMRNGQEAALSQRKLQQSKRSDDTEAAVIDSENEEPRSYILNDDDEGSDGEYYNPVPPHYSIGKDGRSTIASGWSAALRKNLPSYARKPRQQKRNADKLPNPKLQVPSPRGQTASPSGMRSNDHISDSASAKFDSLDPQQQLQQQESEREWALGSSHTMIAELEGQVEHLRDEVASLREQLKAAAKREDELSARLVEVTALAERFSNRSAFLQEIEEAREALRQERKLVNALKDEMATIRIAQNVALAASARAAAEKAQQEERIKELKASRTMLEKRVHTILRPYTPRPRWRELCAEYADIESVAELNSLTVSSANSSPGCSGNAHASSRSAEEDEGSLDAISEQSSLASSKKSRRPDSSRLLNGEEEGEVAKQAISSSALIKKLLEGMRKQQLRITLLEQSLRDTIMSQAIEGHVGRHLSGPALQDRQKMLPISVARLEIALKLSTRANAGQNVDTGGGFADSASFAAAMAGTGSGRWLPSRVITGYVAFLAFSPPNFVHLPSHIRLLGQASESAVSSTSAIEQVEGEQSPALQTSFETPSGKGASAQTSVGSVLAEGTVTIPDFLRPSGNAASDNSNLRIRNRFLSKREVENTLSEIRAEKLENDRVNRAITQNLAEYLGQSLRHKLGLQTIVVEWAYSLFDCLHRVTIVPNLTPPPSLPNLVNYFLMDTTNNVAFHHPITLLPSPSQGDVDMKVGFLTLVGEAPEELTFDIHRSVTLLKHLFVYLDAIRQIRYNAAETTTTIAGFSDQSVPVASLALATSGSTDNMQDALLSAGDADTLSMDPSLWGLPVSCWNPGSPQKPPLNTTSSDAPGDIAASSPLPSAIAQMLRTQHPACVAALALIRAEVMEDLNNQGCAFDPASTLGLLSRTEQALINELREKSSVKTEGGREDGATAAKTTSGSQARTKGYASTAATVSLQQHQRRQTKAQRLRAMLPRSLILCALAYFLPRAKAVQLARLLLALEAVFISEPNSLVDFSLLFPRSATSSLSSNAAMTLQQAQMGADEASSVASPTKPGGDALPSQSTKKGRVQGPSETVDESASPSTSSSSSPASEGGISASSSSSSQHSVPSSTGSTTRSTFQQCMSYSLQATINANGPSAFVSEFVAQHVQQCLLFPLSIAFSMVQWLVFEPLMNETVEAVKEGLVRVQLDGINKSEEANDSSIPTVGEELWNYFNESVVEQALSAPPTAISFEAQGRTTTTTRQRKLVDAATLLALLSSRTSLLSMENCCTQFRDDVRGAAQLAFLPVTTASKDPESIVRAKVLICVMGSALARVARMLDCPVNPDVVGDNVRGAAAILQRIATEKAQVLDTNGSSVEDLMVTGIPFVNGIPLMSTILKLIPDAIVSIEAVTTSMLRIDPYTSVQDVNELIRKVSPIAFGLVGESAGASVASEHAPLQLQSRSSTPALGEGPDRRSPTPLGMYANGKVLQESDVPKGRLVRLDHFIQAICSKVYVRPALLTADRVAIEQIAGFARRLSLLSPPAVVASTRAHVFANVARACILSPSTSSSSCNTDSATRGSVPKLLSKSALSSKPSAQSALGAEAKSTQEAGSSRITYSFFVPSSNGPSNVSHRAKESPNDSETLSFSDTFSHREALAQLFDVGQNPYSTSVSFHTTSGQSQLDGLIDPIPGDDTAAAATSLATGMNLSMGMNLGSASPGGVPTSMFDRQLMQDPRNSLGKLSGVINKLRVHKFKLARDVREDDTETQPPPRSADYVPGPILRIV